MVLEYRIQLVVLDTVEGKRKRFRQMEASVPQAVWEIFGQPLLISVGKNVLQILIATTDPRLICETVEKFHKIDESDNLLGLAQFA